jgi:hypothetical protein
LLLLLVRVVLHGLLLRVLLLELSVLLPQRATKTLLPAKTLLTAKAATHTTKATALLVHGRLHGLLLAHALLPKAATIATKPTKLLNALTAKWTACNTAHFLNPFNFLGLVAVFVKPPLANISKEAPSLRCFILALGILAGLISPIPRLARMIRQSYREFCHVERNHRRG